MTGNARATAPKLATGSRTAQCDMGPRTIAASAPSGFDGIVPGFGGGAFG
jgi:hypothetical protein